MLEGGFPHADHEKDTIVTRQMGSRVTGRQKWGWGQHRKNHGENISLLVRGTAATVTWF